MEIYVAKYLLSVSYTRPMAGPEGFEPPACRLGGGRSIQLSYGPSPLLIVARCRLHPPSEGARRHAAAGSRRSSLRQYLLDHAAVNVRQPEITPRVTIG